MWSIYTALGEQSHQKINFDFVPPELCTWISLYLLQKCDIFDIGQHVVQTSFCSPYIMLDTFCFAIYDTRHHVFYALCMPLENICLHFSPLRSWSSLYGGGHGHSKKRFSSQPLAHFKFKHIMNNLKKKKQSRDPRNRVICIKENFSVTLAHLGNRRRGDPSKSQWLKISLSCLIQNVCPLAEDLQPQWFSVNEGGLSYSNTVTTNYLSLTVMKFGTSFPDNSKTLRSLMSCSKAPFICSCFRSKLSSTGLAIHPWMHK